MFRLAVLAAALTLGSCSPGSGSIDGPYRLEITDIPEDAMLCYEVGGGGCVGRVPQTVFAAGYNAKYIVAARHPHDFGETSLDRSRTEYFYIIRPVDSPLADPAASVRGPFGKASFEHQRKLLGLPQFTRTIRGLE